MSDLRDRLAAAMAPRYIVDRELGSGGMGTVFLGHDPELGREVAIKVLPPELATAVAVERFLREARLLAKLAHPNIVPVYDSHTSGNLRWFVMPRVRGDTLAHRLEAGPLPTGDILRLATALLDALQHAHEHGVIHRDIKPANIFLDGERPLLADFGIALLQAVSEDKLTDVNQVVGTARYMAPEQRAGLEATERSDIYALAMTLCEAVTGRRWDMLDPASVATWRSVPVSLRPALRRALRVDPAARWQSAADFRRALIGTRRRRRLAIVVIVSILGLAALGGVLARLMHTPPQPTRARSELVILPFSGTTDSLGRTLAQFTSLPIEWLPIKVLPFLRVGQMSQDSARRIAKFVVTGVITSHGRGADTITVQVDSAGTPHQRFSVPGDSGQAHVWGQAIAAELVRRLFPVQLTEFQMLARIEPNRRALDAYNEGQRRFQSGDWSGAEQKFAEAEAIDSNLAQASWQKLIARQWQSLPYMDDLAALDRRSGTMPVPLRRLLHAQIETDLDRRFAMYDSLVHDYPNYSMVRQMAANELFGRGPLVGRPLQDGITAFQRSAEEIPALDRPNTYTQTIWGAVRLGDENLARAQMASRNAPDGDPWTKMLWLAVNGRFRRWIAVPARTLMLWLASPADVVTLRRAVRMGLDVDDPLDQLALAKFVERKSETESQRADALAAQATASLLLGRPTEALRQLDRGAAAVPGNRGYQLQLAEWRVLLPLIPGAGIPLPDRTRDSGRATLREVLPGDPLWPRATWTLAVDALARQDSQGADSLINNMLKSRATSPLIADLTRFAIAFRLGADSQFDAALDSTRSIHRMLDEPEIALRGPFVRAFVYLRRGDWQQHKGNRSGADAEWIWHENNDILGKPNGEPEQGELDAALSAIARLLRAENLNQPLLDRRTEACDMLARVTTLWHNAEPLMAQLQARVAKARTAACQH